MPNLPDVPPDPDEMDRHLREITSGQAGEATFREPSAAERTRRPVRAVSTGRMSWRKARKAAKLRKPVQEPGRTRAKVRQARPHTATRGKRRRRARVLLTLSVVLAMLAGVGYGLSRFGLLPPSRNQGPVSNGLAPGLGPAFTAADPFAGTPAEHFPSGASGIVPPAARPVGNISAAQVSAAYATTKKLLVAANLNPQTLSGGVPDSFARLLAPQLRSYFISGLGKLGIDNHGYGRSTRGWVASFAPGTTELVGGIIKVSGAMAPTTAVDSGHHVLRIEFNYLFVYPVQRPRQPSTRMRIVMRQQGNVDFAQWNDPGGPLQAWWLPGSSSGPAGARCDVHDGFIHPEFSGGPPDHVLPSGIPIDPYSQSYSPSRADCVAVTRT